MNSTPPLTPDVVWKRLPAEDPESYAAFLAAVELGPDATHAEIADKTGKTRNSIRNLSFRHNWSERAAAWRQHLTQETLVEREENALQESRLLSFRRQVAAQQDWDIAQTARQAARHFLRKLEENPDSKAALYEIARMFEISAKFAKNACAPIVTPDDQAASGDVILKAFKEQLDIAYGPKQDQPAVTPAASPQPQPQPQPQAQPQAQPQPPAISANNDPRTTNNEQPTTNTAPPPEENPKPVFMNGKYLLRTPPPTYAPSPPWSTQAVSHFVPQTPRGVGNPNHYHSTFNLPPMPKPKP